MSSGKLHDCEQRGKDFSEHSCLKTNKRTQNERDAYENKKYGKNTCFLIAVMCTHNGKKSYECKK